VRAARIHEWGGEVRLEDVPEPRPGEGEVLVRVAACGVGLTVMNYMRGELGDDARDLPRVPGHELVGTVVEAGERVERPLLGEWVTAHFYLFCGHCPRCLGSREPLCQRLAGRIGVQRDGGYAELVALPARNCMPLPADLDPVTATVVPDAVATPVHVCRRAGVTVGDRVAVIGAGGGVGIHLAQVARCFGADVVGLESAPHKLAFLEDELDLTAIASSTFDDVRLPQRWGGRADAVVDLVGSTASLSWSLGHLGSGGRLVILTTFRGVDAPVSPRDLVAREISILGSRYASRDELLLAARLVHEGRVRPVISRREPVERVAEIHADLRAGRLLGRGALVWS
jgi:D-arabinose 1-dehydrogenase-like Zn-dependent alcohol dehydrogenase